MQADFGCGSGSLLDSLLDYPTTLQTIIGVDISPKGLARAAKVCKIIHHRFLFHSLTKLDETNAFALFSHELCVIE